MGRLFCFQSKKIEIHRFGPSGDQRRRRGGNGVHRLIRKKDRLLSAVADIDSHNFHGTYLLPHCLITQPLILQFSKTSICFLFLFSLLPSEIV